jgi:hypothetical protein
MPSEPVCKVTGSWMDVGSFYTRLVVRFMIFTAPVRNILDTTSYVIGNEVTVGLSLVKT